MTRNQGQNTQGTAIS